MTTAVAATAVAAAAATAELHSEGPARAVTAASGPPSNVRSRRGTGCAFNEGYGGRGELATEAIRLGRALAELMPEEPDVRGLLALMLINDARREARFASATTKVQTVPSTASDRVLYDRECRVASCWSS